MSSLYTSLLDQLAPLVQRTIWQDLANKKPGAEQAAFNRASISAATLIHGLQDAMLEKDLEKHELAATSAARAVADLCYQTDADAPLVRSMLPSEHRQWSLKT